MGRASCAIFYFWFLFVLFLHSHSTAVPYNYYAHLIRAVKHMFGGGGGVVVAVAAHCTTLHTLRTNALPYWLHIENANAFLMTVSKCIHVRWFVLIPLLMVMLLLAVAWFDSFRFVWRDIYVCIEFMNNEWKSDISNWILANAQTYPTDRTQFANTQNKSRNSYIFNAHAFILPYVLLQQ